MAERGQHGWPLCTRRPHRGSGEHTGGGTSQPCRRNGLGPPGRWVGVLHALYLSFLIHRGGGWMPWQSP